MRVTHCLHTSLPPLPPSSSSLSPTLPFLLIGISHTSSSSPPFPTYPSLSSPLPPPRNLSYLSSLPPFPLLLPSLSPTLPPPRHLSYSSSLPLFPPPSTLSLPFLLLGISHTSSSSPPFPLLPLSPFLSSLPPFLSLSPLPFLLLGISHTSSSCLSSPFLPSLSPTLLPPRISHTSSSLPLFPPPSLTTFFLLGISHTLPLPSTLPLSPFSPPPPPNKREMRRYAKWRPPAARESRCLGRVGRGFSLGAPKPRTSLPQLLSLPPPPPYAQRPNPANHSPSPAAHSSTVGGIARPGPPRTQKLISHARSSGCYYIIVSLNELPVAGLDAACWSPDQELLVLVTRESSVVMMTAEFDPLIEFPLNHDGFGESEFINIGWGKKETQFHGQQGKAAAKSAKSTVVPVSELDDLIPRISWRGDGEMFAVSYVTNESKCRRIRVINNEGVLQYTSEETSGLEQALSWKPSGSLIASSQRFPNKHDIVFFEKNGLRHGEFSLPFKPSEVLVKEVLWNQDSTVLIVWLEKLENNAVTSSIIQLWTTGNYHWYLKQELRYNEKICHICWDYETPLILHLLTATQYYCYRWSFHTDVSQGLGVSDLAQVGVIDGTKLKMTPFRQAVVPPPMSAYVITFQECIQAVMFAPSVVRKCEASPDSSLCVEDSGFLEAFDPPGCNSNNLCVVHGSGILTFLTQAHASENLDDQG
ncbi:elongator complex protein 1-like, partial [Penaeus vannamei]